MKTFDPRLGREAAPYDWTCVLTADWRNADYPPNPTPVHTLCYLDRGVSGGYQRVLGARQFVVNKQFVGPSLPADTVCYFCHKTI